MVGINTGFGLEVWEFSMHVQTILWAHSASYIMGLGALSQG